MNHFPEVWLSLNELNNWIHKFTWFWGPSSWAHHSGFPNQRQTHSLSVGVKSNSFSLTLLMSMFHNLGAKVTLLVTSGSFWLTASNAIGHSKEICKFEHIIPSVHLLITMSIINPSVQWSLGKDNENLIWKEANGKRTEFLFF